MRNLLLIITLTIIHHIGHAQAWPYVANGYGRHVSMGMNYNFFVLEDSIKPAYPWRVVSTQLPLTKLSLPKYAHFGNHSCISDSFGKLLFIHSGFEIFDTLGNVMQNGDTLVDFSYYSSAPSYVNPEMVQGSIILPKGNNEYDLFNVSYGEAQWQANLNAPNPDSTPYYGLCMNQLYHHVVDMKANNGKGAVVLKKHNIQPDENLAMTGYGMSAIRHSNGVDWWLLKMSRGDSRNTLKYYWLRDQDTVPYPIAYHEQFGPGFDSLYLLTYLVKPDTIIGPNKYYIGAPIDGFGNYRWGQLSASLDGSKLAFGGTHGLTFMHGDFNRCYGTYKNIQLPQMPVDSFGPYLYNGLDTFEFNRDFIYTATGVAYSSNNRFIYIAKRSGLYQYDTWGIDSASKWYKITNGLGDTTFNDPTKYFTLFKQLVTGINGKIYVSYWQAHGMGIIENPNLKGAACGYNHLGLLSAPSTDIYYMNVSGASNYVNYNLGPAEYICWPDGVPTYNTSTNIPWSLYPNPSNGIVRITLPDQAPSGSKWQVYNVTGSLVAQGILQSGTQTYLNLNDLAKGVYYVKCLGSAKKLVLE
jgi:hypothetical protein